MEVLGIDPIHRLVVPRVVAATFVARCSTEPSSRSAWSAAYLFGVYLQNVSGGAYLATLTLVTGLPEVVIATIKAAIFGTDRRAGRLLPRADHQGRPQRRRRRRQRDAGAVRDRAVRGQRRADHHRRAVRDGALTCRPPRLLRARYPRAAANVDPLWRRRRPGVLTRPGHLARFSMTGGWSIGWALRRYRRETLRLIAQIGMGTGAMAVVGGTVGDRRFRDAVRRLADRHPGFRVAGQYRRRGVHRILRRPGQRARRHRGGDRCRVGGHRRRRRHRRAGGHADQRGDRRPRGDGHQVGRVPGIHPARWPGWWWSSRCTRWRWSCRFCSGQVVTTLLYGQSHGTYEHYFRTFLRTEDVFWSVAEVIVMAVIVMITHCYYGYNASGGPVGVGEAVGRSMRFSLVSVSRRPAGLVGALRRRPELQPHGVAAMATAQGAKKPRSPRRTPRRVSGCCWRCGAGACVDIRAVSRGLHAEDQADDVGLAGRAGDGPGVESHLQRREHRSGGRHLRGRASTASRRPNSPSMSTRSTSTSSRPT